MSAAAHLVEKAGIPKAIDAAHHNKTLAETGAPPGAQPAQQQRG